MKGSIPDNKNEYGNRLDQNCMNTEWFNQSVQCISIQNIKAWFDMVWIKT